MLNKLESDARGIFTRRGGVNARQPWNDVNVINITFRERRCVLTSWRSFQTIPTYVCKLQVFMCVNCADTVYGRDPLRSCPVWSVVSSVVCYSRRDHRSDKVARKWSDANLQAGVCLIVHNEGEATSPFFRDNPSRLISIPLFRPRRKEIVFAVRTSMRIDLNGGECKSRTARTFHDFIHLYIYPNDLHFRCHCCTLTPNYI